MPVISIKSLPFENDIFIPHVLKKLNTETAKALGYEASYIWSYWEYLKPEHYAVGENLSLRTTNDTHSPIVNILSFEGKSGKDIEAMLKTVARILSEELKIDIGNFFITYTEVLSGRVFDGGEVVYKK